jgi:NAD(P)-dependent dehydrogenase (short-subunit alcohol dehydrogenase family)
MIMRLLNDVAIITGAGRGIGQAIAAASAAEGARVIVADLDFDSATRVADEIRRAGGEALAHEVDISQPAQVQRMIDETFDRHGRLDVLINNAGVGLNKPFLTTTLEEWELQLRVNLTGTFLCGQAAARAMERQGCGRIVNVASISGQRGGQGRAAYGAAKAGVILLTKVMAVELSPIGIRVNAVCPGPVDTDQSRGTHTPSTRQAYYDRIPARRYGEREEIAAAALFLASKEASFVNGHVLNVDGGFNAAGLIFEDGAEKDSAESRSQSPIPRSAEAAHGDAHPAAAGNGASVATRGHAI